MHVLLSDSQIVFSVQYNFVDDAIFRGHLLNKLFMFWPIRCGASINSITLVAGLPLWNIAQIFQVKNCPPICPKDDISWRPVKPISNLLYIHISYGFGIYWRILDWATCTSGLWVFAPCIVHSSAFVPCLHTMQCRETSLLHRCKQLLMRPFIISLIITLIGKISSTWLWLKLSGSGGGKVTLGFVINNTLNGVLNNDHECKINSTFSSVMGHCKTCISGGESSSFVHKIIAWISVGEQWIVRLVDIV